MGGLLLNGFVFVALFRPPVKSVVDSKQIHNAYNDIDMEEMRIQSLNSGKGNTDTPCYRETREANSCRNDDSKVQTKLLKMDDKQLERLNGNETKSICSSVCGQSSLLRDPAFIMFSLLAVCQYLAFGIFYAFIKAFALSKGIHSEQATYIVSMSGLAELCGNLVLPLISDFPFFKKIRLYLFMLFSIGFGILYAVYPMVTDYSGLLVCVFVTVFMTSQVHTLRIPFAISVTGTKETNLLIGLTTLFMGIGQAIGPIIGGG